LGSCRSRPGVLIPLRGEPGKAVSAVAEMPAHWRWRGVVAVPVVPARPTRERERQEEGHRRPARPQVTQVRTPWVRPRPGPAVADHEPVLLPGRVMVIRPGGDTGVRDREGQRQIAGCLRGLQPDDGEAYGECRSPIDPYEPHNNGTVTGSERSAKQGRDGVV